MENSIHALWPTSIQLLQFHLNVNGLSQEDIQALKDTTKQDWGITIVSLPEKATYDIHIKHMISNGTTGPNLICETLSTFRIVLVRELRTREDFPMTHFYVPACEAAASNRAYLCQLTNFSPFHWFLPPTDSYAKMIGTFQKCLEEFLRGNREKGVG